MPQNRAILHSQSTPKASFVPENHPPSIVVIGGGHAAAALCAGLVDAGQGARLHLVCEEARLPYQRPPLSKAFLKNPAETLQFLRTEVWYRDAGVTVHLGDAAVAIDRSARQVTLRSGAVLNYCQLVLATGTRARHLPGLEAAGGGALENVAALRSADDAERLRGLLARAQNLTVLGGGFIGLEIAATARALGKNVAVLEAAPRLLARSVSPELAAHALDTHRASGIDIRLGVAVGGFDIEGNRLLALQVDGERVSVDEVVRGVGAVAEHQLASAAGLECTNGVVVDAHMRTSDANILAIGDCVNFPDARSGQRLRLESVQNANDQGRTAAATLLGRDEPYRALPWFWSEQGAMRLQMAGLMPANGERYRRSSSSANSFSIFHYVGSTLMCVESVNAPLDHMAARKLLEAGKYPMPAVVCDGATLLKSLL